VEVWLHAFPFPGRVAELAREAEAWGFTGLLLADSQNLTADIWVELAQAGAATAKLRLGPGVTNPLTRHIAVTASAAITLQAETGGRATLGFAQGDSALSRAGLTPLSVTEFEHALMTLQSFLRGDDVALPDGSPTRISWPAALGLAKVPVHVAASGPRTIAAAARHAEGVDLTLGAELDRLSRAAATAREAGGTAPSLGAYVNVAVHPDRAQARSLVRGSVATFARFSAGAAAAQDLSTVMRRGVERATGGYHSARHGEAAATFAQALDDEFIDRYALIGPAAEIQERIEQIRGCGIERMIAVFASFDTDHALWHASVERFAIDVLPGIEPSSERLTA
jgi:5,10-methylenetetrahydromethanopterin reductase